jgi:transposase
VEVRVAQAAAKVLRLPPYSPDFNPIESCWSKVKTRLRGAAARSGEALNGAIDVAWHAVTPQGAQGWFTLRGYRALS